MRAYRQGDVVLKQVRKLPEDAKQINRKLRMTGETGNPHVLEGEYKLYRAGGRLYVVVEAVSKLVHPEHSPITVKPGIYEVERVRSFDLAGALEEAATRPPIEEIRD